MTLQTRDLAQQFAALLDEQREEQAYQAFLEQNPRLIPREFLQNHGVHFDLVLRKLALARDYITDFFYLAKSSADWHCVLVEIEKPSSHFFREGTADLHAEFVAALDQIHRWRAWFLNSSNFDGFVNGTIKMLRIPASMTANPCHVKYVLVMGRRKEFEENEQRRALISAHERDDFHILSYDSLLEALHSKGELYVGVRRNDHIQLVSGQFAGESLFAWMPPEQLRMSKRLRDEIGSHRGDWFHYESFGGDLLLDRTLPKIPLVG